MRLARIAVALGSLVVVIGFCLGVDTPISTTVDGQTYQCADVIPAGMLVSGQSTSTGPDLRTVAERRRDAAVDAACRPLLRRAQWAVWSGIGLGGLVLLAGWTVLREREHDGSSAQVVAGATA